MSQSALSEATPEEPWVLVATFRDLPQAHVARGTLEAQGLTVALTDEYTVGADWLMSIAIGGVGLGVKASQEEAAREILEHESFDAATASGLPVELQPEPSEEQAKREEEFVEARSTSKRFRAATAIFFIAPIVLPLLAIGWLLSEIPRAETGPR